MFRRLSIWIALLCLLLTTPVYAGEIHQAVAAGDLARVKELLRANPDLIRAQDENPMRDLPLHTAAINDRVEIARYLLDAGADVNCGDKDGSTPLHDAALLRKRPMVELLLSRGADVKLRDQNGAYALSFATFGGDSLIVRKILDAGADLDFRDPAGRNTLMHSACSRGLFWFAEMLKSRGVDINVQNGRGETPLNWVCQGRFPQRLERTLALGGNPAIPDTFGMTPLHTACWNWNNQPEMARILLARGVDVNATDKSGRTPLFGAVARGDTATVRMLLDRGASAKVKTREGNTPVLEAADGGRVEVASLLLKAGATTNDQEPPFGWTPLHKASALGYQEFARLLIANKVALNLKDDDGRTPLQLAVQYGHRELAGILKGAGAKGEIPGGPTGLASVQRIGPGEAEIWYLGHSSWGVKTANRFLIFDYGDMGRRADRPALDGGDIDPAEIAGQRVTVFASHEHGDHFIPAVFDWKTQAPQTTYVLGFRPQNLPNNPAYEYMEPDQTKTIDGIKVTTIRATDSGVGFLVDVDGISIFHSGDHANTTPELSAAYKTEIDWLVQKGARPDIAFLPLVGCGASGQGGPEIGAKYTLSVMRPKVMFPMHGGTYGTRYVDFIADISRDNRTPTKMVPALCKGDHFHYSNGTAS
jgi:uncharacterized protein